MKSEVKAAFQKAAKEHEARAVERLREQEKRLTDRDQFEAGWRDTRARIVLPALRQIREAKDLLRFRRHSGHEAHNPKLCHLNSHAPEA